MSSKQDKAIKLMVYTNLTQRDIAKEIDIREETISRWKKSESFQSKIRAEQDEFIKTLTAPAMRTMKDLLGSKSDYVRFQAAQDILDRTGYKPSDKVDINSTEGIKIIDDIG